MPRSGLFLEATISMFNSFGQTALAHMRTTQEELRTDTFDLSRSIGRVASLWLDAIDAVPSSLITSVNGPLPSLFIVLQPDDTTLTRQILVAPPERRELEFTGLDQLGGSQRFDSRTVRVDSTGKAVGINVIFTDLDEYRPAPGLYQGVVHVGDLALAVIIVRVNSRSDAQAEASTTSRSRKKR
jgi:hypothetical protein